MSESARAIDANLLRREEELFAAARCLTDSAARRAFLDQACRGNPGLRARLETLLATDAGAEEFFNAAAPPPGLAVGKLFPEVHESDPAPPADNGADSPLMEAAGARLGPYKLLQKIGEGGCGVVYMAEQERPVRRRVALKIIKLGMDTKNVIARFEAERQALAMMDHPNIARVLDAGATEAGRPYFVMELVRGVRITDYCDQNNLDTRRRLDLFIHICHAVQHAHQKGIIHRDLKPSNVLVTLHDGVPVPKIIDFGIAKATEGRLTEKTLFTAFEHFIGTPAYMSPEQAELSGLDVDTRSDIYSLGVLLYELLTGKTPFDARELVNSGFDEMRRTLREKEPQRPSIMLTTLQGEELSSTALHRRADPPRLILLLKGDVDWIVMKALEKDRTRRYETANGLAMDIRRYLGNEPVLARPPSRLYRFQKLVGRNRGVFAAVGAVAAALVLGFGTSTWLFFKERDARQRAIAAEQQQSRLREDAERGRARENELRLAAEAREAITQAAALVDQGEFERADNLIAHAYIPRESLEGATIFRSLGDWNAIHGRWEQAADRFEHLRHLGTFESGDYASLDCERDASALIELADPARYDNFRVSTMKHFSATTDPVTAERIVKVCSWAPAGRELLNSLAPLAEIAVKSFGATNNAPDPDEWALPWRCVSLALWEYRRGHWPEAAAWSRRCLGYGAPNTSRTATARLILAMAQENQNLDAAARETFLQASEQIEARFKTGLDQGNGTQGFWFDWMAARQLEREALRLIPGRPGSATRTALAN